MKYLKKLIIYIRRHLDFLILDLITFAIAYVLSVQLRRAIDIRITHDELFLRFGIVAFFVYLFVVLVSHNLNGILSRSLPREMKAVSLQMISTWSIYTVILFMLKEAHEFSRTIYALGFLVCSASILIVRTIWKAFIKYSGMNAKVSPLVLVITDRSNAQKTLQGILPGSYENIFKIVAVITNEVGKPDYHDWYPYYEGLDHIPEILSNHRVQDAFVALSDSEDEKKVFNMLINAGVIIHRSLGDNAYDYASEHIDVFGGKSVITIDDTQPSLVSRVDKIWKAHLKKKAEKKNKKIQE